VSVSITVGLLIPDLLTSYASVFSFCVPQHQAPGQSVASCRSPVPIHDFAASDFLFWRRIPISMLARLMVLSCYSHHQLGSDAEFCPPSSSVLVAQTLSLSA
jgi:hypothetical protein